MNCKNCGKPLLSSDTFCRYCGTDCNQGTTETTKNQHPPVDGKTASQSSNSSFSVWVICSLVSFVASAWSLYRGIDKMTHYYSSEFSSSLNVNAYVGGDAYNYIINGTYTTAFFVLAVGFFLGAIGFLILHYMNKKNAEKG